MKTQLSLANGYRLRDTDVRINRTKTEEDETEALPAANASVPHSRRQRGLEPVTEVKPAPPTLNSGKCLYQEMSCSSN